MLNNRHKNKKNKRAFKSYTDINNYNNFLLELDKKNIDNKIFPLTNSNSNSKTTTYNKENINVFVKDIDNTFVKLEHSNPNFNGISPLEALLVSIEKHLEPNTYISPNTENTKNKKPINKLEEKVYTKKVNIQTEINNIGDLLKIIELYPDDIETEYNIDIKTLHKIKEPLTELNSMIGMKELKQNIVDQIIFYIQNLHTFKSEGGNDFMHTVIYGPPGTGKTEIAKIIGSIFSKIGILSKGTFKKVIRADLVAGYLGQTALKTRDVIKECIGGVLFIDEAYALGNEDKRDSFSKECIDTLCEALSDHKDNLMVIIAGYETDLNNCFFNYNQGLSSRFTWRFKTGEYNAEDLYKIFIKKVNDSSWHLAENSGIDVKWFEKNKGHFNFYGRDIETLFAKTKIAHSRRVFCLDASVKKYLTLKDLEKGLDIYLKNEDTLNKEKKRYNNMVSSLYC